MKRQGALEKLGKQAGTTLAILLALAGLLPNIALAQSSSAPLARISFETLDSADPLDWFLQQALAENPKLQRLRLEVEAARARVPQVRALPDPMIQAMVFVKPMPGTDERANLMVSQRIPWLHTLSAQGRQAAVEAAALEQVLIAEHLKVSADVKRAYYQLYVLGQKIRINETNQALLKSLIKVATARVGVGAPQGDVLRATLELSRLSAELIQLTQQKTTTQANLNALLNRPSGEPIPIPEKLGPTSAEKYPLEVLQAMANAHQPELVAAALRQEASQLGVQIARLRQVPDLTVGFTWYTMEENRTPNGVGHMDQNVFSIMAGINIPVWKGKYQAMRQEAQAKFFAAAANRNDLYRKYEAAIADALKQAQAFEQIVRIYEKTMLPQARQTLEVDSQAYSQGKVEFDRVITDFNNLINLEAAYHQHLGQWATALAQLEQFVGIPVSHWPPPRP